MNSDTKAFNLNLMVLGFGRMISDTGSGIQAVIMPLYIIAIGGSAATIGFALQSPEGIAKRFHTYAVQLFEKIQNILSDKSKVKTLIQIVTSFPGEQRLFSGLAGLLKTAQMENPKLVVCQLLNSDKVFSIITFSLNKKGVLEKWKRAYWQMGFPP